MLQAEQVNYTLSFRIRNSQKVNQTKPAGAVVSGFADTSV